MVQIAIALHQYQAAKDDELSLMPGDLIKALKRADDGWMYGHFVKESPKSAGWLPSNFVNECDIELSSEQTRWARSLFDYKAQEIDELNLKAGDVVTIVASVEDDGWFRGILHGKMGVFPSNFVQVISRQDADIQNARKKSASSINGSTTSAPVIGNTTKIPANRRSSLTAEKFMGAAVSGEQIGTGSTSPTHKKFDRDAKTLCTVVVTFDYASQQPDELQLKKGQIIQVQDKQDDGWWTGVDSSGKQGVFPYNFVRELTAEEVVILKETDAKAASSRQNQDSAVAKPKSGTPSGNPKAQQISTSVAQAAPPISLLKPMITSPPPVTLPKPQSAGAVNKASSVVTFGKGIVPSQNMLKSAQKKHYDLPDLPPMTDTQPVSPANIGDESLIASKKLIPLTKNRVSVQGRKRAPSIGSKGVIANSGSAASLMASQATHTQSDIAATQVSRLLTAPNDLSNEYTLVSMENEKSGTTGAYIPADIKDYIDNEMKQLRLQFEAMLSAEIKQRQQLEQEVAKLKSRSS